MNEVEIILEPATSPGQLTRDRRHARRGTGRHVSLFISMESKGGYSNPRMTGRVLVRWSWGKGRTHTAPKQTRFASVDDAQKFADSKWAQLLVWVAKED